MESPETWSLKAWTLKSFGQISKWIHQFVEILPSTTSLLASGLSDEFVLGESNSVGSTQLFRPHQSLLDQDLIDRSPCLLQRSSTWATPKTPSSFDRNINIFVFSSSDAPTPAKRRFWSVFVIQPKSRVFTTRTTTTWWLSSLSAA